MYLHPRLDLTTFALIRGLLHVGGTFAGTFAGALIAFLTIRTAPGRDKPRTGARLGGDVARSALIGLGFALGCRFWPAP